MGSGPAGIDYLNQFEFQLPVGGKRNLESSSPCRSGSNSHPGSSCRGTHVRVRKRVEPVVGDALIRVRDYEIPGKETRGMVAQGRWFPTSNTLDVGLDVIDRWSFFIFTLIRCRTRHYTYRWHRFFDQIRIQAREDQLCWICNRKWKNATGESRE